MSGADERARVREGEVLPGGVRLGKLIAVGGMAAVYAARSKEHGVLAVKVMHREMLEAPNVRARFLREGKLTMSLVHPGVPKVHAMHELPDGTVALVMELLRGEDVEKRIARRGGYLAPQEVLAIADKVLEVLEVAHAKDVIHRDIKPENVFLTDGGELKLLDFGVAKAKESSGEMLTFAGFALGTPAFMAPEQANGRWHEVDARTDLWALGATMFAALAGRAPHDRENAADALLAAATLDVPSITTEVPSLRPAIGAVVDKALSRKREDRYADAREMRAAVREAWSAIAGGKEMQVVWDHVAKDVVVEESAPIEDLAPPATLPPVPVPVPVPVPEPRRVEAPPRAAPPARRVSAETLVAFVLASAAIAATIWVFFFR